MSSPSFEISPTKLLGSPTVHGPDLRAEYANDSFEPTLFLPVRLETRFDGPDLKVRIYPDQIHLDEHQVGLTTDEQLLGQAYWERRLSAAIPEEAEAALAVLASALSPRRALYVARMMKPDTSSGAPVWPSPPTRTGVTPARAACLPDRWCVVGYTGNTRLFATFGAPITSPLPVAPDLASASPYSGDTSALPVDGDFAWMVDYDEALLAGMAVTVAAPPDPVIAAEGLTLLVFGIRGLGPGPSTGAQELEALLEAHHYTDGLELIPQGAPTNNTDSGIAGWTAGVDDVPGLFARELDGAGPGPSDPCAATQLSRALGLGDNTLLAKILGGSSDEDRTMAAMNRALWGVTWGRYLDDLLANGAGVSIVPAAVRDMVREWFVERVRGGAPLPSLAVGPQPYGILPAFYSTASGPTGVGPIAHLEGIIQDLRERWRESIPSVPRLDPVAGGGLDEIASTLLGTHAHPGRFTVRNLSWQFSIRNFMLDWLWALAREAPSTLSNLDAIYRATAGSWSSADDQLAFLQSLDDPGVLSGIVAPPDVPAAQQLVQASIGIVEGHRRRQRPLASWYPAAFSGVFSSGSTSDPKIFYAGYGDTADRVFERALVTAESVETSAYLMALRDRIPLGVGELTPGAMIASPATGIDSLLARDVGHRDVGTARARARATAPITPLVPGPLPSEFFEEWPLLYQLIDDVIKPLETSGTADSLLRNALYRLAQLDDTELELRLRETLGLASHRIDAWHTALASDRLAAQRAAPSPQPWTPGLRLGAFGWVEGLRRDAAGTRDSSGFIHAPSLAHAVTAGVLRSGYEHHVVDDPDSLLAVDLRSERVRTASTLLDGVRQGQRLGDLLGCRFERRLHDDGLDAYIDICRRRVAEAAGLSAVPRGPVDGLELVALYHGAGIDTPSAGTITPDASLVGDGASLQAALDDLLEAMDAVADVSVADSVHHLLQGNSAHATATLDSISTGAVAPPELRSLATPRPSASVSHRVVLTLADGATGTSTWGTGGRAAIEPSLDEWLATMLPAPSAAVCTVSFEALADETPPADLVVSAEDLVDDSGMSATDLVFEASADGPEGDTFIARRVLAYVLGQPGLEDYEGAVSIDFAAESRAADQVSFFELLDLAWSLRSALGSARQLRVADLAGPGAAVDAGWDLGEASTRLLSARDDLQAALAGLVSVLPTRSDADPHPVGEDAVVLRTMLAPLAGFGLRGSIAARGYADGGDHVGLWRDAWGAHDELTERLARFAVLEAAETEPGNDEVELQRLRDKAAAILGRDFPLMVRFTAADVGTELEGATARSDTLLGGDGAVATDWLRAVARVRPDVGRLEEALSLSELVLDEAACAPVVGQLPIELGEPWLAIGAPSDRRRGSSAWFVVDHGGLAQLGASGAATGLLFDAWAESIPTDEVVTGLAINFDAPSSRAPQAMILGLTNGDQGDTWTFDRIIHTLLDTLESAKMRAVDPDVLLAHGHQIPAIFAKSLDAGPQEIGQ